MDNKKVQKILKTLGWFVFGIILFSTGAFVAGLGTSRSIDETRMYAGLVLVVIGLTIIIFRFIKLFDD